MTNNNHRRAIVFDFGGVLVDWNPYLLYRPLFNNDDRAIKKFLDEIGFAEWNLEMDRGRSFAESVAELSERFPQYADLIRAYDEEWEKSVSGFIEPTVNILRALKRAGYPVYGLSNWSYEKFQLVHHKYKFLDLLDGMVISGQVNLIKPDPRIFYLLLEKIGKPADQCIFIDDSKTNTTAARELGFAAIHYQSPEQLQSELEKLGVRH
jgi:2-haloacid dehalogenase